MKLVTTLLACATVAVSQLNAADATIIRMTDKVMVPNIERLGVHFSGDTFYDSVILKQRVAENFEGGIHRLHVIGPAQQSDPSGMFNWDWNQRQALPTEWIGAAAHVLCGPDIWKQVKVVAIEERPNPANNNKNALFYVFDQPVRWDGRGRHAGVMLERSDVANGQHPWIERRRVVGEDGRRSEVFEIDSQYCSPENTRVVSGDTPPEVGQHGAFELDGSSKPAFFRARVQFNDAAPFGGKWTLKLWAKATAGEPSLEISPTVAGTRDTIQPSGEWQQYTLSMDIEPAPAGSNPIFMLNYEARGGTVLIDRLEAWKNSDIEDSNPTPFRDELVEVFRFMNPGSVRYLRNTKDTAVNSFLPRIENFARDGRGVRGTDDFGTHEFYQFCQYIGANPWATLPGTLLLEEMDQIMEYHGAPADVGLGKLRARLGQEEPWTEVFDTIHLQFGNEAITFFGTGFYGPDYWSALIARAKASPYWQEGKFVFHLNEQGCGIQGMDDHPAFDRFTINGYHIFGLYQDQIDMAGDLPGFYDYVFASAWHMWKDSRNNKWWSALQRARQRGKEISIYEGLNYHTTFGSENPPMDQINRMMAGYAGGVSATHTGLLLLKHWGGRTQQNFNLSQLSFSPGGAFGNLPERIRGWGGVLQLGNDAERRYRPRFLAQHVANKAMFGNLVATLQSGADPEFEVTNRFGAGYGPSRNPEKMTLKDIPRIHSYGFKDGKKRGLILVSMDPRNDLPVVLQGLGRVAGGTAEMTWVKAPGLQSTNEHDWAPNGPEVTIASRQMDLSEGTRLDLPAATILSLTWKVE